MMLAFAAYKWSPLLSWHVKSWLQGIYLWKCFIISFFLVQPLCKLNILCQGKDFRSQIQLANNAFYGANYIQVFHCGSLSVSIVLCLLYLGFLNCRTSPVLITYVLLGQYYKWRRPHMCTNDILISVLSCCFCRVFLPTWRLVVKYFGWVTKGSLELVLQPGTIQIKRWLQSLMNRN